jgi:hypothetical protein
MNVLEGVDVEEQEPSLQEFINISIQLANFLFFFEKLELQSSRNFRLTKRAEIKFHLLNAQSIKGQVQQ